jgi:hypothetical protein
MACIATQQLRRFAAVNTFQDSQQAQRQQSTSSDITHDEHDLEQLQHQRQPDHKQQQQQQGQGQGEAELSDAGVGVSMTALRSHFSKLRSQLPQQPAAVSLEVRLQHLKQQQEQQLLQAVAHQQQQQRRQRPDRVHGSIGAPLTVQQIAQHYDAQPGLEQQLWLNADDDSLGQITESAEMIQQQQQQRCQRRGSSRADTFEDLGVDPMIVRMLPELRMHRPTPVQVRHQQRNEKVAHTRRNWPRGGRAALLSSLWAFPVLLNLLWLSCWSPAVVVLCCAVLLLRLVYAL